MGDSNSDKSCNSFNKSTQRKMNNLAIALFSTLVAFSNALFWEAGPCPPKPEVVTPLEPERYLGDWYSVYETPMPFTTRENTCNRWQYGPLPQGVNNVSVYITTTYPDSEELGSAPCAWMQPVDPMNPTGDTLLYMGEVGSPSWIIDTDYEPLLQASPVKRDYLVTIRMLSSSQGTPLLPKKLLTRPLRRSTGTASSSMTGSLLFTPQIVSMTTTKTDGAGVPWSNT